MATLSVVQNSVSTRSVASDKVLTTENSWWNMHLVISNEHASLCMSLQDLQIKPWLVYFPKYIYLITINLESWRFTTTLTKLWRVMVSGHRSENHSSSSSGWFWQRWTNTQRAGMEDGRGVYQKHKTRQVRAHTQTNRANCGRGWGTAPRILPSFSSVWWILEGFLRPDRHLPSRLKKFSSSSRPYSIALPSDSFTALVNLT